MYLILAILAIVILVMKFMTDGTDVMVFLYGVFIVIVFSTVPFGNCSRADAGFLQMLPATTWQRVMGRFLFGLSLLLIGSGISIGCMVLYQLYAGIQVSLMAPPFYMMIVAIGMLIITLQYIILYVVGESRGAQFLSVVRMIPGMSFFFASLKLIGAVQENPNTAGRLLEMAGNRLDVIGWGSIGVALAVMAAGVIVCVKVTDQRDY